MKRMKFNLIDFEALTSHLPETGKRKVDKEGGGTQA
jgi:hypothetical protein